MQRARRGKLGPFHNDVESEQWSLGDCLTQDESRGAKQGHQERLAEMLATNSAKRIDNSPFLRAPTLHLVCNEDVGAFLLTLVVAAAAGTIPLFQLDPHVLLLLLIHDRAVKIQLERRDVVHIAGSRRKVPRRPSRRFRDAGSTGQDGAGAPDCGFQLSFVLDRRGDARGESDASPSDLVVAVGLAVDLVGPAGGAAGQEAVGCRDAMRSHEVGQQRVGVGQCRVSQSVQCGEV